MDDTTPTLFDVPAAEPVPEPAVVPMDLPRDTLTTVSQARAWVQAHAHDGCHCPVCGHRVQVYRRKLNRGMALALARLYAAGGCSPVDKPKVLAAYGGSARDESLLRFWGLLAECDTLGTGWWQVTRRGEAWLRGRITVPSHIYHAAGEFYGADGVPITFADTVGEGFRLDELLNGGGYD